MLSANVSPDSNGFKETLGQGHGSPQQSKYLQRVGIDVASAAAAGFAVSPLVTVIDTAVTEVAFGTRNSWNSIKHALHAFATQPHRTMSSGPFVAIFLLYAGTYATTNLADTAHSLADEGISPTATSSTWGKLGAISAVNMGLALYKEAAFAKAFSLRGRMRPMPMTSCGIFVLRDSITLFASFNLPPLLAPKMPQAWEDGSSISRLSIAQLAAPAVSQLIATPLHLWGLDLYNNPGHKVSTADRLSSIRRYTTSATAARICRVIPGLGVGNVINTRMRTGWIEKWIACDGRPASSAI